jgi:hypothetical protein
MYCLEAGGKGGIWSLQSAGGMTAFTQLTPGGGGSGNGGEADRLVLRANSDEIKLQVKDRAEAASLPSLGWRWDSL